LNEYYNNISESYINSTVKTSMSKLQMQDQDIETNDNIEETIYKIYDKIIEKIIPN